ncbi:MAG: flagellar hook-basal body complex protein [Candidatus Marinimicrobia bacterium]|nr:flagellar hook-basal body complex protein [Candidatus Neomarinimicrobiota bacterium]
MLKSLTSAVTGLKNFTIQLDVLGNNLANVRTLGFKSSRVTFAEASSQALSGVSKGFGGGFGKIKQVGLGVGISSTDMNFEQGSLEYTGQATDLAVRGKSFFVVSDGEKNRFTRAGNFFFNDKGFMVSATGLAVQGWSANSEGEIDQYAALQEVYMDTTLTSPAAETTEAVLSGNLDAGLSPVANVLATGIAFTLASDGSDAVAATALNDLTQTSTTLVAGDVINIIGTKQDGTAVTDTFTYATDGTTLGDLASTIEAAFGTDVTVAVVAGKLVVTDVTPGDSETSLGLATSAGIALPTFEVSAEGFTGTVTTSRIVYDSLGEAHNLILTFTKEVPDGEWTWAASFTGDEIITDGGTGTITFDEDGQVVSFGVDGAATGVTIDPGNSAGNFTVQMNVQGEGGIGGVTQYASDPTVIFREVDGRPLGDLLRFAIDTDGVITGVFSNEENLTLAQIALAEFSNPAGLLRADSGLFDTTSGSGNPIIGKAGEQFTSAVISGSLETSNVDLVRQFTDMITTQRGFQANARVVTTADQILDETMRLKR